MRSAYGRVCAGGCAPAGRSCRLRWRWSGDAATIGAVGSYSYAFGPVVAFIAIGVLVVILRWAFGSKKTSVVAAAARPGTEADYGMLVPVASPSNYVDGEMLRRRLENAGIRANLATTLDGPRVLVWPTDEQRARDVIKA